MSHQVKWLCLLLLAGMCLSNAARADGPLDVGDRAQLFIDQVLVRSATKVAFTLHPAQKHPRNPLIKADRPWEGWRISIYGTVLYDQDERLFKMWYTTDESEDFPNYAVAYATSVDGVAWEKPLVGTIAAKKTARHNAVVAETHLPSVIKDLRETDPARRYKMLGCVHLAKPVGGPHTFVSPDGLKWTKLSTAPICRSNDVITMFDDRARNQYVALPKLSTMVRGQVRRCFGLSTSSDFLRWTEPRYIFQPDLRDDAGSLARIAEVRAQLDVPDDYQLMRTEFYGVGVYQAESCVVAFPWVFTINNNARYGNHDGPCEIQLAASRDLDRWERPFREPIVPHGMSGEWDSGFLTTAAQALRVGDEVWLYYTGANHTHGAPCIYREEGTGRGTKYTASIGRATWKLDRFVSADGPAEGGTLTTVPIIFSGNRLELNAATRPDGNLTVELLDLAGRVLATSQPFIGDDLRHTVAWKEAVDLAGLAGQPLALRFGLRAAELYSFAFRSNKTRK
jgi:hypothetical protein